MNLQLALTGAIPALLAMWYFDRKDAARPEPRATLWLMAAAGGLAVAPLLPFVHFLDGLGPAGPSYYNAVYRSFVVAAIPEEALKLACLILIVWKRPEFDERMDGIVYATRAALGFALVENILYLMGPKTLAGFLVMFSIRAVMSIPMHAIAAGFLGYYATRKRFDGEGPGIWGGFALAVAFHGLYDTFSFSATVAHGHGNSGLGWLLFGCACLMVVLGAIALRKMIQTATELDRTQPIKSFPNPNHSLQSQQ